MTGANRGTPGRSAGRAPWEIGAPQPALLALADSGVLRGRLLDVGCGTGEHTLMAAGMGLDATGIDCDRDALTVAGRKARERGLTARFVQHDALALAELAEVFDTALDSLLLHALTPEDRSRYLDGLRAVLRPGSRLFALCYSDRHTTQPIPPHLMSRGDIESCFADGWTVDSIQATTSSSTAHADGVAAWLVTCTRVKKGTVIPVAEARVRTDRASRYLAQLCGHTARMSVLAHANRHGEHQIDRPAHLVASRYAGHQLGQRGLVVTTLVDHNTCPASSIAAAWCASFPASTPTHTLANLGPPHTTPPGPPRMTPPTVPLPATSAQISISGQGAADWLGDHSSAAAQRQTNYSHTQPTQRPGTTSRRRRP